MTHLVIANPPEPDTLFLWQSQRDGAEFWSKTFARVWSVNTTSLQGIVSGMVDVSWSPTTWVSGRLSKLLQWCATIVLTGLCWLSALPLLDSPGLRYIVLPICKKNVVCLHNVFRKMALVPSMWPAMSQHWCHIWCPLHNIMLSKMSNRFLWRRPSSSGYLPSWKGMSMLSSPPRTQPLVVLWISLAMTC